jgi:hypothetical protein
MKREYAVGTKENIDFFWGTEVENTPATGLTTLFVVGVHDIDEVVKQRDKTKTPCQHIYLGANQSFDPGDWQRGDLTASDSWDRFIKQVLNLGVLTTLDFDVKHVEWVLEGCYAENNNFIPQISVKIPYIEQLRYNATVKIDDIGFKVSNPGVWCHSLHDLMDRKTFTAWNEYTKDLPL